MTSIYQVMLVEQDDACRDTATLRDAPFASRDAAAAKQFADAFNARELVEPLGLWAVVRHARCNSQPCG